MKFLVLMLMNIMFHALPNPQAKWGTNEDADNNNSLQFPMYFHNHYNSHHCT